MRKYRSIAPSIHCVRISLTKNILGLGGQFFVIMISMLFIFQFINIILSRVEGPDAVTQYNIAYKYFNVLNRVATIILTPFWSAFTDAYVKKDYEDVYKRQQEGDVVIVPAYDVLVKIDGKVKRPMRFEMKKDESLSLSLIHI